MNKLKLHNSEQMELFEIFLTEEKYPIAYANRVKCLMASGMTEKDAKIDIATYSITLEIYYEQDCGLMAVESEAVESGTIYSPYTGEAYEQANEEEID